MIRQHLHTHSIFLRCAGTLSDLDLLRHFGLSDFQRLEDKVPPLDMGIEVAVIAEHEDWMMIADGLGYKLWNQPSTHRIIESMASSYDVFACFHGDCDKSFEFRYYREGKLARRYAVLDNTDGLEVVLNIGDQLPCEVSIPDQAGPAAKPRPLSVAQSLGIKTSYTRDEVRIYMKPGSLYINGLGRINYHVSKSQ